MNSAELATEFRYHVKTDSNFKRLQRFLCDFELDYSLIILTQTQKSTEKLCHERRATLKAN